jgi:hypothetical protein
MDTAIYMKPYPASESIIGSSCPRFRLDREKLARCDDVVHILMVKFETYQIQIGAIRYLTSCFVRTNFGRPKKYSLRTVYTTHRKKVLIIVHMESTEEINVLIIFPIT